MPSLAREREGRYSRRVSPLFFGAVFRLGKNTRPRVFLAQLRGAAGPRADPRPRATAAARPPLDMVERNCARGKSRPVREPDPHQQL